MNGLKRYTRQDVRLLTLLSHIGDAAVMDVDGFPDPVIVSKLGVERDVTWDEWDELSPELERRGWAVIEDDRIRVTWDGEKALNAWQRKGGRSG